MKRVSERKVVSALLLLFLIAMIALVGCSPTDDEPASGEQNETPSGSEVDGDEPAVVDKESFTGKVRILTPWGFTFQEEFGNVFADFNKEYPNIEVELMEQLTNELGALIAAGEQIDIISTIGPNPDWVADDLQEDLTVYYESDPEVSGDLFYEPAFARTQSADGRIWSMPWHVDPNFAFMYHPDILEQEGYTEIPEMNSLAELGDFLSKFWIVDAGEQVMTTFQPFDIYGPLNTLQTLAYLNGASRSTFYDPVNQVVSFNDPVILETLEWIVQFKRENIDMERLHEMDLTLPEGTGRFLARKSLLEPHVTPTLRANYEQNPDLAFAPMPANSLWLGGWDFGMTSISENKDAAWEFLKWLNATEAGNKSTQEHFGWIGGLAQNPYLEEQAKTDPITAAAFEVLQNVRNAHLGGFIPVNYEPEFNEKWNEVIHDGTLEPKAFLDHMTNYIQTLVDELE